MWLKCPGTLSLHFSQSARYPILNDFFMPGCKVQLLSVCFDRWCPFRGGDGVVASTSIEPSSTMLPVTITCGVSARGGMFIAAWLPPMAIAELDRGGSEEKRELV